LQAEFQINPDTTIINRLLKMLKKKLPNVGKNPALFELSKPEFICCSLSMAKNLLSFINKLLIA